MKNRRERTRPEPTRCMLAAEFDDLKKTGAGWTFWVFSQFYDVINDRGWLFFNGSFTKTNRERAARGRVFVHDGHNLESKGSDNVGRVIATDEVPRGNKAHVFLSRTEEELAQKVNDRTIQDVSVDIFPLAAERIERPVDDVPVQIRNLISIEPSSGMAEIRGISEVLWMNLGLVGGSSQDADSIISSPLEVAFQDLPLSLLAWDPAGARARVDEWAGQENGAANLARLCRAHLIQLPGGKCFGQVADVVEGELVAVVDAMEAAQLAVRDGLGEFLPDAETRAALSASAAHLDRYREKGSLTPDSYRGTSVDAGATLAPNAQEDGAGPPADTPETEPPQISTHSDKGSTEERLRRLILTTQLQQLRHETRARIRSDDVPAVPSGRTSAGDDPG